jgi:predicted dinucleotide-binding enzyme
MAGKKIGVLGSGTVGETLANGFLKHGFDVMRGSREPKKLAEWQKKSAKGKTGTFEETARFGELVVLAVKGTAAESALAVCGTSIDGKIVIDTTNPIADRPPEQGVLTFFTGPGESLFEKLQQRAPKAKFVKAFSCVGDGLMVDPDLGDLKPTMFICGNDSKSKTQVAAILDEFGWETEDMGPAAAARGIEPLCMLWCIPGFQRNDWTHAFKMLRPPRKSR